MKKWIGAICPAFKVKGAGSNSGWELLTDEAIGKADITAVTWYRIFAWILVVLAIVLIVMAVLQVLANLGVIKMPAILAKVNAYALIAIAVVAVLTLVANFGIRAEMIDPYEKISKDAAKEYGKQLSVGIALWLVTIVNVAAAVCGKLFAKNED